MIGDSVARCVRLLFNVRILAIDDETAFWASLERSVDDLHVISVQTAAEALAAVVNHSPDVVLCNLQIPDKDGLELIGRIKTVRPGVRCILAIGPGFDTHRLCPDATLAKPWTVEALRELLQVH
jgi:DNA-binding NtrC family response regulator